MKLRTATHSSVKIRRVAVHIEQRASFDSKKELKRKETEKEKKFLLFLSLLDVIDLQFHFFFI